MTDSTSGTLRSYGITDPDRFWQILAPTFACFSQDHAFLELVISFQVCTVCLGCFDIIYKLHQFTRHLKPHFLCKCFLLNGYHSAWTRSARKHVERIDLHELNADDILAIQTASKHGSSNPHDFNPSKHHRS